MYSRPGRRLHRPRARRLDRRPRDDQREDQPDDQAQPDEQRPRPDERRRTARRRPGPAPVADPGHEQHDLERRRRRAGPRASRMSGASGSFGVTRYQWPRIIAAKTPPMAALTTASWTSSGTAPSDAAAPGQGAEHERRGRGGERRPVERRATPRRRAAGRPASAAASDAEHEQRDPARRVPGRVDHDRRARRASAGRAPSESQARTPKPSAHSGREAAGSRASRSVRRRSRTTAANEPRARPVRTVQLMKARFWAICVAGTARV